MVIYVTLINLTKMECVLLLLLKSYLFLCLCVLESLTLKSLSPPVKYFTDRFKAVLLLCRVKHNPMQLLFRRYNKYLSYTFNMSATALLLGKQMSFG